jgi:hypothetical protein
MNETEARELRQGHDGYVRSLYRKPKTELASLYRQELAARGRTSLYGGPGSKDELVNALVFLRYPIDQLNESIHVLHHQDSNGWTACQWCHPHGGAACECELGRAAARA